jgi:hypothetical protein
MSLQKPPFKLAATCQNATTAFYQAKIKQQKQFLNFIKPLLNELLAEHLVSCVILGRKLILYTDAEEWATQLRFYQPMLLDEIAHSSLITIEKIEVWLILPPVAQQPPHKVIIPSKQNIELIRDNLQTIADEELKSALLRLSQTLERLS